MVKIGPTFSDFVTREKTKRYSERRNFLSPELIEALPLVLLILFFLFLVLRLFYIQIVRGDYYRVLSENNRTKTVIITAPRGIIYDRNGKVLVSNAASYKKIEEKKVKWLDQDEALKLIESGQKVDEAVQRQYIYKNSLSHVLGYVGQISEEEIVLPEFKNYGISDFVGQMGLERQYENLLHGKSGKELFEIDAGGNVIRSLGREEPVQGKSINTTIDLNVQLAVSLAFENVKKGAVVVSDPRNGEILALYSKPDFDPNIFTHNNDYEPQGDYSSRESTLLDNQNQPLLDRAIGGVYPPGSTFKLVTAIAALEQGTINSDTKIDDTGVLRVGAFSFGNWYFLQHGKTEGLLDVVGAIKRSNDIFFYKAAESAGVSNISAWAKKVGLGEKLGIDIPGEASGTVPDPSWKQKIIGEPWYLGDTYNYGIGQGYLLTTPLQVNSFTTVFANDGILYKPHLMKNKTQILRKDFLDKGYVDLVREGMRESCESGGVAWPFFDFKVKNKRITIDDKNYTHSASDSAEMVRISVGCKTGTSESGGEDTLPHAWITVFAPFYNPEIVVTVLVENSGEGSSIAGPIARDILKDYFTNK
ncbi:MAG: hypothetical protein COU27_01555 [Candidatus Levybacteria bacterium CG10_big_fil_rev_8_21_14_0_10_36_7]|nr:MAG: hypothetical protein COU27_01555 [Candidatus Levybacteria bacterium CG10_big_fil_rev_8_21_14_0_10_36_7]